MNVSLFEQTECKKFFHPAELSPKIEALKATLNELESFVVESLEEMLQGEDKPFPFEATYDDACWDPVLVLHSSGSTGKIVLLLRNEWSSSTALGPPKPVVTNHATWAILDNDRNLPTVNGRKNQNFALFNFSRDGGLYYSSFPPFHVSLL